MSTISNGISTAAEGLRRNAESLNDVAKRVAAPSVDGQQTTTLAVNVVEAIEYSNAVEAAADAVRASNESLGELLDVLV